MSANENRRFRLVLITESPAPEANEPATLIEVAGSAHLLRCAMPGVMAELARLDGDGTATTSAAATPNMVIDTAALVPSAEPAEPTESPAAKRRGRPPGSKNRANATPPPAASPAANPAANPATPVTPEATPATPAVTPVQAQPIANPFA